MRTEKKIKNRLLLRALILVFIASGFFSVAKNVSAATLNISPYSGTHAVGETFPVLVTVSSNGQSLNAVDATVSFPSDKLQVVSVSKDGSIINLWAEEPNFSNGAGKVSLSGVVLNPGFSGSAGRVLKINLKVIKTGNAAVVFSSGSILANDGMGTDILTGLNSGQFTLIGQNEIKNNKDSQPKTTEKTNSSEISPTTLPWSPDNIHSTEENSFNFFSPFFLQKLKIFTLNISTIILLLVIISVILFIVLRTCRSIMLLRLRLRSEAETDRKNKDQIIETKKKLMDALHLAETTKSELTYQQTLLLHEKEQKEQSLEENKKLNDFLRDKEASWSRELENNRAQAMDAQKKLKDAEHLLEESKSQLAYQENILAAEKAKREQIEEESRNSSVSFREKESSLKRELEDSIRTLEQELRNAKKDVISANMKLTETEHLVEESKAQLVYQDGLLLAEKSKYEKAIEEHQNTIASLKETESNLKKEIKETKLSLEREIGNEDEKLTEYKKKLADTEHLLEETKSELIRQQESLLMQKDKLKESDEESKKYRLELREKEVALEKALSEVEIQKGKEATLRGSLASMEEDINSTKNKLNDATALLKQTKAELTEEQELFAAEKAKREESEEEHKKIAILLNEKDAEFEKQLNNEVAQFKEKEAIFKKKLDDAESLATNSENKMTDAMRLAEETKAELAKVQKLLETEKEKTKSLMAAVSKLILPDSPNPPNIPNL